MTQQLTTQQMQTIAEKMPEIIRAALRDVSLTGLDVTLVRVKAAELCHPLTEEQTAAIRRMVTCSRDSLTVEYLPAAWDEGLLTFRVSYDFAGYDADGNAIDVQAEGALGLDCEMQGGGSFREMIAIRDVIPLRLREDGTVRTPGKQARSMRLRKRKRDCDGKDGIIGTRLDILGAVLEIVLEVFFDG